MWTSTTGFSINVLMLDHKLRQRLHYSLDSDFHVRPGYIIAFRKELISWKQKSEHGNKIAIFVWTTNGSIHYISNMKLLEIKEIENIFGFSYFFCQTIFIILFLYVQMAAAATWDLQLDLFNCRMLKVAFLFISTICSTLH